MKTILIILALILMSFNTINKDYYQGSIIIIPKVPSYTVCNVLIAKEVPRYIMENAKKGFIFKSMVVTYDNLQDFSQVIVVMEKY